MLLRSLVAYAHGIGWARSRETERDVLRCEFFMHGRIKALETWMDYLERCRSFFWHAFWRFLDRGDLGGLF